MNVPSSIHLSTIYSFIQTSCKMSMENILKVKALEQERPITIATQYILCGTLIATFTLYYLYSILACSWIWSSPCLTSTKKVDGCLNGSYMAKKL